MPKVYRMSGLEAGALIKTSAHSRKAKKNKMVRISKDHPYYRTSNKGSISEARLVIATHLSRNLTKDDNVYRKSDDYDDNSVNNLLVLSLKQFAAARERKRYKKLKARIESYISVYEQRLADSGIDPAALDIGTTVHIDDPEGRWRQLDREREASDRSRRYGETEE